jgi:hypothetical protein
MSLAPQKSARRNVLQAELLAVVGENLRALAQSVGVLAEVLRVGEVITAGENPGADAPHACSLQDFGRGREVFQSVVKSRLILAKLHRQTRSAESEILRPQVVKEMLEPIVAQRSEVVGSGSRPSKPCLTVSSSDSGKLAWKPRRPRLKIA